MTAPIDRAALRQKAEAATPDSCCIDGQDLLAVLDEIDRLERHTKEALHLATLATNNWACHARTQREHDTIATSHAAIAALRADLAAQQKRQP